MDWRVHFLTTKAKFYIHKVAGEPMTPEAHLVNTRWFRAAIAIPIALGVSIGWFFTLNTPLELDRSAEGMNTFLQIFKLPIGIAGLALPIVAVVAANHRSMQTAKQLVEQNSQNIFSTHLEHRRFFTDFVEQKVPFKEFEVSSAQLYDKLFPNAVDGNLRPDFRYINDICDSLSTLTRYLSDIFDMKAKLRSIDLEKDFLKKLSSKINTTEEKIKSIFHDYKMTTHEDLGNDFIKCFKSISRASKILSEGLIESANFHRYYISAEIVSSTFMSSKNIDDIYASIKDEYNLAMNLRSAIQDHLDSHGSVSGKAQNSGELFRNRLSDIDKNLRVSTLSPQTISRVFDKHLPENKILTTYLHAPDSWKRFINLSSKDKRRLELITNKSPNI